MRITADEFSTALAQPVPTTAPVPPISWVLFACLLPLLLLFWCSLPLVVLATTPVGSRSRTHQRRARIKGDPS